MSMSLTGQNVGVCRLDLLITARVWTPLCSDIIEKSLPLTHLDENFSTKFGPDNSMRSPCRILLPVIIFQYILECLNQNFYYNRFPILPFCIAFHGHIYANKKSIVSPSCPVLMLVYPHAYSLQFKYGAKLGEKTCIFSTISECLLPDRL